MINHGDPAEALSCRVRILRYFVLAWIFSLRSLSRPILLRFKPTEKLSDATLQQKLAVLNCDPCTTMSSALVLSSKRKYNVQYGYWIPQCSALPKYSCDLLNFTQTTDVISLSSLALPLTCVTLHYEYS